MRLYGGCVDDVLGVSVSSSLSSSTDSSEFSSSSSSSVSSLGDKAKLVVEGKITFMIQNLQDPIKSKLFFS